MVNKKSVKVDEFGRVAYAWHDFNKFFLDAM